MARKKAREDVSETAHKIWLAGLGALAVAEEEGSKLFARLVEQGRHLESGGREGLGKAKARAEEVADKTRKAAEGAWGRMGQGFDERVAEAVKRLGIPSQQEISSLAGRVEELTRAVERLRRQEAKTPASSRSKPRK